MALQAKLVVGGVMTQGLAYLSLAIVVYAAVARRLERWSISMPLVFTLVGLLLGPFVFGILALEPEAEEVKALTEITLALLLFADASTVELQQVRHDAGLPVRLLSIGILLSLVFGALLAFGLFPAEGLAFAVLISAILAPTDAALGLPIFNNPKVPLRIRRALNVESGLNDGIATPVVTLCLGFAVVSGAQAEGGWLATALREIAGGVAVGVLAGGAGAWLLRAAKRRGWMTEVSEQFAMLGLGLAAYFCALAIHGNGFVAAFIGGIVFGAVSRRRFAEATEFSEHASTFLSLLVWVIFGAVLVGAVLSEPFNWRALGYAVLSLTLVRMLAVAIALLGTKLRSDTVALMGWFGPRGLASVVFTLLAFVQFEEAGRSVATLVVGCDLDDPAQRGGAWPIGTAAGSLVLASPRCRQGAARRDGRAR